MNTAPQRGLAQRTGMAVRKTHDLLWGASPSMMALKRIAEDMATTDIPVLLVGESGVGKEALARYIHDISHRSEQTFVKINCRTFNNINGDGSRTQFTHLSSPPASGGTLLLDAICDVEPAGQRQLLDLLPEPEFGPENLDVPRLISTAREGLEDSLKTGKLLEEFYFRLNGVCLRIPALRERKQDIPEFIDFFLTKYEELFSRTSVRPDSSAMARLTNYVWPGNVRQLENAIRKLVITGDIDSVLADLVEIGGQRHVAPANGNGNQVSLKAAARAASRQAEKELLSTALLKTHWNRKRAAQELQISYKALLYKLKQLGLEDTEIS